MKIPVYYNKNEGTYFIWISFFGIKIMKYFKNSESVKKYILNNCNKCFEINNCQSIQLSTNIDQWIYLATSGLTYYDLYLEEKRREEEQNYYFNSIVNIIEKSINLFEELPENLKAAENYLDQVEIDFNERAFAPFWDSIEYAINKIGIFDENINKINKILSTHKQLSAKYEANSPTFPISKKSISKLAISKKTSQRLNRIVRIAQRDFEFSTIFEQRKTNKILVAGFNNLAQALEQMTRQITDSIGNLQQSVDAMSSSLNSQFDSMHKQMDKVIISSEKSNKSNQGNQNKIIELAKKSAEREKRALAMLDNIQYRREPSIFNK